MSSRSTPDEGGYVPLTDEEMAELCAEPDMPLPSAYHLGTNEGRCGFLEAYMFRGEEVLFEAVNHAWNSLSEPRAIKCIYMGMYAGTGGSGKWALAKMLRHGLNEYLDYQGRPPWGQSFPDIHQFHAAAMDYFADDRAFYLRTVQKYADILNGEPGRHTPIEAKVLPGPWPQLGRSELEGSTQRPSREDIRMPRREGRCDPPGAL